MAVRILVTGPSGNVGRPVVEQLVARGAEVRCGVRRPDGAGLGAGTTTAHLDFEAPETFAPAVAGCDAVFLLRPPAISRVGPTLNRFVDVARGAGVRHVVFLSVAGAARNPIVPHHRVEQHLRRHGPAHTILRPGFFAENLTSAYPEDIREGRLYVPAGDGRVAFVDARDLGEVAAGALLREPARRRTAYLLTGPEALGFDDVARLLSERLGRPVCYEPANVLGYWRHLERRGLPRAQIAVQTVLHVGLARGNAETVDPTLGALLGRAPRTMRDFVTDRF